jgi:hypothetical protein
LQVILQKKDAHIDSIRNDPHYEQLLRKQNLPEELIQKRFSSCCRFQRNGAAF